MTKSKVISRRMAFTTIKKCSLSLNLQMHAADWTAAAILGISFKNEGGALNLA